MRRIAAVALLCTASAASWGQTLTGTIAGVVRDSSGAVLKGARIRLSSRDTSLTRVIEASQDGRYAAEGLAPGAYVLVVEVAGFKRTTRDADVRIGMTTAADFTVELGDVAETVSVIGATPLIRTDQHHVAGVVGRDQIENLPLNGRNFLDLAKLEPGVTDVTRGTVNRTFVSMLGAGLQTSPRVGYTRVTVDGGDVGAVGTIGASIQVSQDAVQEFQLSTANFDASTGLTSNGAVNIITRSGGSRFHGGGFFFYRDHHLAAYPALQRDPPNLDPFFQRQQFGATLGGPLWKDRASFFASYERNAQRGVASRSVGAGGSLHARKALELAV
jgi:hypothetical protein